MSPEAAAGSVMTGGHRGTVTLGQVQLDRVSAPSFPQRGPDRPPPPNRGLLLWVPLKRKQRNIRVRTRRLHLLLSWGSPRPAAATALPPPHSPPRPGLPGALLSAVTSFPKPQPVSAFAGARTTVCSPGGWVENVRAKLEVISIVNARSVISQL